MDIKELLSRILQNVMLTMVFFHQTSRADDFVNPHPNHRHSLMSMSDLANHWIGMPKPPYVHYSATLSSTTASSPPPTSAPISVKRVTTAKPKKTKKKNEDTNSRRRSDGDTPPRRDKDYNDMNPSSDYDYDYDSYMPTYAKFSPPSPPKIPPFPFRGSSNPKTIYLNPLESSSSPNKVFAAVPKVATYVIPSSKTYVVRRVKSEQVYIPPVGSYPYASSSNAGMRRQDPLDYDDNPLNPNIGPQSSFPPRQVMNQIATRGQRQPCHGPECHQHHKGLVRFYWRRVIYPPGTDGRRRRPAAFRNRRRFRDRARSPSDAKETFTSNEDDESEENDETIDDNDYDQEDDFDDEADNTGNHRQTWRPGKAYGHDLDEGKNYNENDRRVYRDKRFVFRPRSRPKIVF